MTKHSGSQMLSNGYTVDQDRRGRERIAGKNLCTANFCNYHANSKALIEQHIGRANAVYRWTCDNCNTDYCSVGGFHGHGNLCDDHKLRETTLAYLQAQYPRMAHRPIRIDPLLLFKAYPVSTPVVSPKQRWNSTSASTDTNQDKVDVPIQASEKQTEDLKEQELRTFGDTIKDMPAVAPEGERKHTQLGGAAQQSMLAAPYSSNRLPSMSQFRKMSQSSGIIKEKKKKSRPAKRSKLHQQKSEAVQDEGSDTTMEAQGTPSGLPSRTPDHLIDPAL